jgi:hypothetical protein
MGVGHSTVYEEPQVYTYAVRYLLETSGPLLPPSGHAADATPMFEHEAHDPRVPRNTMVFLPWALRGGACRLLCSALLGVRVSFPADW